MSMKIMFLVLIILIGHCRNENCTFLNALKYSSKYFIISIKNVSVPKLCTDIQSANKYLHSYEFKNCEIKELGTNLFKDYVVLDIKISYNSIKTLNSFTFCNISVSNIILETDEIENIEENAFFRLNDLTYLSLKYNKIKILNPTSFHQMPNLITFSVSHNKITILKTNTTSFVSSKYLSIVDFGNNEITMIQPLCFTNINIPYLYLNNNPLETLQNTSFKNVTIMYLYLNHTKVEIQHLCNNEQLNLDYYLFNNTQEKCPQKVPFIFGYFIFPVVVLSVLNIMAVVVICKRVIEIFL